MKQATSDQERCVFATLKQLCQGHDLERNHLLRRMITPKTYQLEDEAWKQHPHFQQEWGRYEHVVKQVYNSFLISGTRGARRSIRVLSICDGGLCGLLHRYASQREQWELFGLPVVWTPCIEYKHEHATNQNDRRGLIP